MLESPHDHVRLFLQHFCQLLFTAKSESLRTAAIRVKIRVKVQDLDLKSWKLSQGSGSGVKVLCTRLKAKVRG